MAEPLRIGITCYPTHGGSGAVAVDLASALVARGHEVHVISYATPFRLSSETRVCFHGVDVPAYPLFKHPPYAMALASKLAEVAVNYRLQVLHAHYAVPHSMAALLARQISEMPELRVVTTLHGTDITLVGSDPSYRPATAWAIRRSDAVTAVSRFLVEETKEDICEDCSLAVIPNFVDTARYRPAPGHASREGFSREGELLISHTSNFRPVKRVEDVVRIFALLKTRRPARLVMIGDGPERPKAERQARELGIQNRVVFTGLLPDALPVLQESQAFLLPSAGESFGLAALEAMACGVPVVGARAGGLPEVVRDGTEGILEPTGAVEAMAARLTSLLEDPEAWQLASRACRERAEGAFDQRHVVPAYEGVYRAALDSQRGLPGW